MPFFMPVFDPVFPLPIIVTLLAIPMLVLLYVTARSIRHVSWWKVLLVFVPRLAAILLLGFILLNPVESVARVMPDFRVLTLVDRSASMSLGKENEANRYDQGRKWATDLAGRLQEAGLKAPQLRSFSDSLDEGNAVEVVRNNGSATNLAAALEKLSDSSAATANHIHIVSDGCVHDRSELSRVIGLCRAKGTVISTHVVGSDTPPKNAWIARVDAPRIVRTNARVSVAVTVMTTGVSSTTPLKLRLLDDKGMVLDTRELPVSEEVQRNMEFDAGLRTANYVLELSEVPGENSTEDNRYGFSQEVSTTKMRMLFVDGTHHKRRFKNTGRYFNDMELITRAWESTGEFEYLALTAPDQFLQAPNLFQVSFHNGEMLLDRNVTFPTTREELFTYDGMIISDIPVGNFSAEQMQWVVDWVIERGAGFLMAGGYTTFDTGNYDKTVWEKIIPADMKAYGEGFVEEPYKLLIPQSVRNHPIWRFSADLEENDRIIDSHPQMNGMVRIKRVKPGAQILAVRPDTNNEPLIAAQSYGRGRSIAYMPDTNGGWAYHFIKWAPEESRFLTEVKTLGTGYSFRFNANDSKEPADVVVKEHPSKYYGMFWTNTARWLCENSIRWKRENLSGRALSTSAQPGKIIPVAAEVLAVTRMDDLLQLDVGVRINRPGSPRVGLTYDRDKREFLGSLLIPENVSGDSVELLFDCSVEGKSHADRIPVSVMRANQEFLQTTPDQLLMKEIASAGGSQHYANSSDLADAIIGQAMQSQSDAKESWKRPLWTRWELFALIAFLLSLEWLMRRRWLEVRSSLAILLLMLVFTFPGSAEEEEAKLSPDELIRQLGDPKVRLRDEAEALLKKSPDAIPLLEASANNHPSEEARIRIRKILKLINISRWYLAAELADVHIPGYTRVPSRLVSDTKKSVIYSHGQDHGCLLDAKTLMPLHKFGKSSGIHGYGGWEVAGPRNGIAMAPDGKRCISNDDSGVLMEFDTATGEMTRSKALVVPDVDEFLQPIMRVIWAATYSADGKYLVLGRRNGTVVVLDNESWDVVKTFAHPATIRELFFTPDQKYLISIEDTGGEPDYLNVYEVESWEEVSRTPTPHLINSCQFMADGKTFYATYRDGQVLRGILDQGKIQIEVLFSVGVNTNDLDLSPAQKSYFVCGAATGAALTEYDLTTHKVLWSAGAQVPGAQAAVYIDEQTLISIHGDYKIRVWRKNKPGETSMPPALVRTHMESFDPEWAYDLEYEGKGHEPMPLASDALLYEAKTHRLVSRGQDQIIVWDATDLVPLAKFGPRCDKFRDYRSRSTAGAIAIADDGKQIVAADDDGVMHLYEMETGNEIGIMQERIIVPIPRSTAPPNAPGNIVPIPRSPALLDSPGNPVTPTQPSRPSQPVMPTTSPSNPSAPVASGSVPKLCWSIEFDSSGDFFYSTHLDGYIRKWSLAKKDMVHKTMAGNIGANIDVSPNGKMLATLLTPADHGLLSFFQINDIAMLQKVYQERVPAHSHNSMGKFSQDGKSFYHALADGRLEEWKITESGAVIAGRELLRLPWQITDFQISDDQQTIVIACISDRMTLSVWNLETGRLLWQAPPGQVPVWRLQLMPDDRIATLGVDNILRTYSARKKAE